MRILLHLFALLALTVSLQAGEVLPLGKFKVINSAGFVERGGKRQPLGVDLQTADVTLRSSEAGSLLLTINGSEIVLYEIENGLAALTWNSGNSSVLGSADILDLSALKSAKDVPAWGANVDWPTLGTVHLVLLPLRQNAYTGFLISHPGRTTVVRQMEFRKVFGPLNRPDPRRKPSAPTLN